MRSKFHIKVGDLLEGNYAGPTQVLVIERVKKHKDKNKQIWRVIAITGKYYKGETTTFNQKTLCRYSQTNIS